MGDSTIVVIKVFISILYIYNYIILLLLLVIFWYQKDGESGSRISRHTLCQVVIISQSERFSAVRTANGAGWEVPEVNGGFSKKHHL